MVTRAEHEKITKNVSYVNCNGIILVCPYY